MNSRRLGLSLALGFLFCSFVPAGAERLQMKNGLEITGDVVGADRGSYLVRIGSYTKRIPEFQVVVSIVDDAAALPVPGPSSAAPPQAARPAATPSSYSAPPAASLDMSALQSLLGGAGGAGSGGSLDSTYLLGGGGGAASGANLTQLMGVLTPGGGGAAAGGANLSQLLGALSTGGGSAPAGGMGSLGMVAEKMKDPAFQQQFLSHIEEMNAHGPNPGAATPYIGMLKGLFSQLNTQMSGAAARPR